MAALEFFTYTSRIIVDDYPYMKDPQIQYCNHEIPVFILSFHLIAF